MPATPIDHFSASENPSEQRTFKTFTESSSAQALADLLQQHAIPCSVEQSNLNFELSSEVNASSVEYRVRIRKEDFDEAQGLLEAEADQQVQGADEDHYLFRFDEAELLEVLKKPDEWNAYDYALARKILKDRNLEVTEQQLNAYKEERLNELSRPHENQQWWILFAYTLAFFGGLFGILIGLVIHYQKKTLPNGSRVYSYSDRDRKHGITIVVIGCCVLVVSIFLRAMIR